MKILDVMLNVVIVLSVTVVLAYVGRQFFDYGLFTVLPENTTAFFLRNGALQYVAFGLLVASMTAKLPVGRALRRRKSEKGA